MKHRTPTLHEARARIFFLAVALCVWYAVRGAGRAELLLFAGTIFGLLAAAAALYLPMWGRK